MPSTKTTKEKEVFSKNDSTAIKGIAIIMMLLHHCFRDREIYEGFAINFYPFSENMVNILGIVCKMCVGMFVFITGYGLSLSLRKINKDYQLTVKETCQWTVNRAILALSGFWIISFPSWKPASAYRAASSPSCPPTVRPLPRSRVQIITPICCCMTAAVRSRLRSKLPTRKVRPS